MTQVAYRRPYWLHCITLQLNVKTGDFKTEDSIMGIRKKKKKLFYVINLNEFNRVYFQYNFI